MYRLIIPGGVGGTSRPHHPSYIAVRDPFTANRPALGLMTGRDTSQCPVTKKRPNTHEPQNVAPVYVGFFSTRALVN